VLEQPAAIIINASWSAGISGFASKTNSISPIECLDRMYCWVAMLQVGDNLLQTACYVQAQWAIPLQIAWTLQQGSYLWATPCRMRPCPSTKPIHPQEPSYGKQQLCRAQTFAAQAKAWLTHQCLLQHALCIFCCALSSRHFVAARMPWCHKFLIHNWQIHVEFHSGQIPIREPSQAIHIANAALGLLNPAVWHRYTWKPS